MKGLVIGGIRDLGHSDPLPCMQHVGKDRGALSLWRGGDSSSNPAYRGGGSSSTTKISSKRVLEALLDAGFVLREDIIKLQHKMKGTREKWRGSRYDFYLIAHEHLYVFRKPAEGENLRDFNHSVRGW